MSPAEVTSPGLHAAPSCMAFLQLVLAPRGCCAKHGLSLPPHPHPCVPAAPTVPARLAAEAGWGLGLLLRRGSGCSPPAQAGAPARPGGSVSLLKTSARCRCFSWRRERVCGFVSHKNRFDFIAFGLKADFSLFSFQKPRTASFWDFYFSGKSPRLPAGSKMPGKGTFTAHPL